MEATSTIRIQSKGGIEVVRNIVCSGGKYTTHNCSNKDDATAINRNLLEPLPLDLLLKKLLLLKTLKIWNITKTENAMVAALLTLFPLISS
jgi:hypothetical protein